MPRRLAGKAAFVTGAGSGIGRAAALLFAREGAKVALVDINRQRMQEVCSEISTLGAEYAPLPADIANPLEVEAAYRGCLDQFGRLDIVFANAGINGTISPLELLTPEEWKQTIDIDLTGTFYTLKYAIPALKDSGGGSVIITSSINGNRVFTNFGMGAYGTAKAGQVALMKMAALELARYKIRVNAVCPGAISTDIEASSNRKPEVDGITIPIVYPEGGHPLAGESGRPEQVAKLVLFLASDDSDHITGTEIYIDGAESLLRG
ncbi:3-ketoacyl-ACP reductase [Paenibacillus beijingensis]|uniref:3-ketoacyl-ACP reductase n=2 Tax=Paenibacillus beijingensis TaxID=1126833 RepID=A0A0D5NR38_9BACL|nr:3-ketoacyl-ACP reductase [Paenibacillus beijingensis]